MTGLQATAVDSYPLGHVIDPPPRVQGIERIAQPFQVLLGHFRHDINVNRPQQGSLQATGEAPENDVVNSMTIEHLTELPEVFLLVTRYHDQPRASRFAERTCSILAQ
jgi:hypothetical protein